MILLIFARAIEWPRVPFTLIHNGRECRQSTGEILYHHDATSISEMWMKDRVGGKLGCDCSGVEQVWVAGQERKTCPIG